MASYQLKLSLSDLEVDWACCCRKYPHRSEGGLLEMSKGEGFHRPNFLKESIDQNWSKWNVVNVLVEQSGPWPRTLCFALVQDTFLSEWPLSTQEYNRVCVPGKAVLEVTLQWTSIPSKGREKVPAWWTTWLLCRLNHDQNWNFQRDWEQV